MRIAELKLYRFFCFLVVLLCTITLCCFGIIESGLFYVVYGASIFAFIYIHKSISYIKSQERVLFLLDKLVEKMKEQGVTNIKDLKK